MSAVTQVVLLGATLTAAAAEHLCSRDSVRRWLLWVAQLADPSDLEGLCLRIDPDGMPVATRRAPRARQILQQLERLADLLTLRGVGLPRSGSGLTRILADRLKRFGEVLWLTKPSPPLRADLLRIGI